MIEFAVKMRISTETPAHTRMILKRYGFELTRLRNCDDIESFGQRQISARISEFNPVVEEKLPAKKWSFIRQIPFIWLTQLLISNIKQNKIIDSFDQTAWFMAWIWSCFLIPRLTWIPIFRTSSGRGNTLSILLSSPNSQLSLMYSMILEKDSKNYLSFLIFLILIAFSTNESRTFCSSRVLSYIFVPTFEWMIFLGLPFFFFGASDSSFILLFCWLGESWLAIVILDLLPFAYLLKLL